MAKPGIETKYRPDKDFKFWLYDPDGDGLTYYRTESDRDKAAAIAIDLYLDTQDGWNEEVERVTGGVVTHCVKQTDVEHKQTNLDEDGCDEDGNSWNSSFDVKCNYEFKAIEVPF